MICLKNKNNRQIVMKSLLEWTWQSREPITILISHSVSMCQTQPKQWKNLNEIVN